MKRLLNKWLFDLSRLRRGRVSVRSGLVLDCWLSVKGPGRVEIGRNCRISALPGTRVKMVTLYTHSEDARIVIGDGVHLISSRISSRFSISIGKNVIIEDSSILDTDFHTLDISRRMPEYETLATCQVILEDDVKVGARSIITKGVTLGKRSLVFPAAVVQRSFPADSVLIGNPAKNIKHRSKNVKQ